LDLLRLGSKMSFSRSTMSMHSDVLSAHPTENGARVKLVEECKTRGNAEFGSRRLDCAAALYTKAIEVAPSTFPKHTLYGNRSATRLAMNKPKDALEDAESAIKADATWAKGFVRKALALQRLERFDESLEALEQALVLEPSSKYVKKTIKKVNKAKVKHAEDKKAEAVRKANEPKYKPPPPPENFGKKSASKPADAAAQKSSDMRGYKILADGTKTSYFHMEVSEEAKKLVGDIRPKKLDSAAKKTLDVPKVAEGASAWNSKGTFEEKDRSTWSKENLTTRFKAITVIVDGSFAIRVTDVSDFSGDASIAITAKRKACLFDFKFTIHWSAESDSDSTAFAKGKLKYSDVCHDELDDLDPETETVRAAKASDPRAALVRAHTNRTAGLLQKKILSELKNFQIEFNRQ